MSIIKDLLAKTVDLEASDVHIKFDQEPYLRHHGRLVESGFEKLSGEDIVAIVDDILPSHLVEDYKREHEADFSHVEEGIGRFRVNVFQAQGAPNIVMRYVKTEAPSFEMLGLPPVLTTFAQVVRGIILMSGTTGSGKSTTLAAIINYMNANERRRIITMEDPVEYLFQDDQCIITQREIGLDTGSFHAGLKHVMRQDPDVIMVGEMRDSTSFMAALAASETGHLVLSTLHAGMAHQSIYRILDFFPATERDQIRMSLAANMYGIVCQRLVPMVGGGVVPAAEVMINTPTIRKLLSKNKIDLLPAGIETGGEDGMQTFNQSIYGLIKSGKISEAEGMKFATNPEALRMNLQGIFLDEGKRILSDI
jgi:twitching motility protein PilT